MSHFPLLASYSDQSFVVDGADFDGTNDYMTRGAGLTGAADSKTGILSVWVRLDGSNNTTMSIFEGDVTLGGSNIRCGIGRASNNKFELDLLSTTGSSVAILFSNSSFLAGATWRHILASWDAGTICRMYVDDISESSTSGANTNVDYTLGDWVVGGSSAGTFKFNGAIAELYFAPGQFLDLTIAANRRKFRDADGKPANLGTDGSRPTGTAPLIYQHLDNAEAVANFAVNAGTGGNFSITGTLETSSTSPSD